MHFLSSIHRGGTVVGGWFHQQQTPPRRAENSTDLRCDSCSVFQTPTNDTFHADDPSVYIHLFLHIQLDGCNDRAFFDSRKNRLHEFCSLRHRDAAIAKGRSTTGVMDAPTCRMLGCSNSVYRDLVTGQVRQSCCTVHR